MKQTNQTQSDSCLCNHLLSACRRLSKHCVAAVFVLLAGILCGVQLQAQTAAFKAGVLRVTVPLNFTGTAIITNLLTIGTNGIVPDGSGNFTVGDINLTAAGVPSTPAGLTLNVTDPSGNPLPTVGGKLTTSGFKTNVFLALNLASVPEGVYTFSLNASGGATNSLLYTLQVGYIWNGSTNVVAAGPGTWSDGSQWLGGSAPGPTDDVIFGDSGGGQTNSIIGGVVTPNVLINADTTVASLRYAQSTNNNTKFETIQIGSGHTLTINGTYFFSLMKDYLNVVQGVAVGCNVTFLGTNGALLNISNETANVSTLIDNAQAFTWDMSGLNNFSADVNRFTLGDYTTYPNYFNLEANNYGTSLPAKFLSTIFLARNNVIKAVYADPFNYTNADNRHYGLSFLNTEISGSTTTANFNFGITNFFFVDGVNFGGGNSRGSAQFNTALLVTTNIIPNVSTNLFTNSFVAVFRNTNGGRMSVFAIADGAGTNTSQTSPNNPISFAAGTVDILADRFYIGRDRKLIPVGQNPNYQGSFFMGKGIVDANTVILGFREYNQTNAALGQVSLGYCVGKITVTNSAVFKANQSITLGSTVATNANEESTGGNTDQGQITVGNGGTVMANTILVGGPVYLVSRNNTITINGGTLIVSNTIASVNQYLDSYTIMNGGTNQLSIDGNNTAPYVFTTNITFSTTTTPNVIRIASIKNLSFPATVPLIFHTTLTSGNLPAIVWPSGFTGSLIDNGANNTIDLSISTNSPKHLLWRGAPGANWDLTSANWLDQTTGLMTNFGNFDIVAFDDGTAATNISVTDIVVPTAINMTNNLLNYTFNSGGGQISGSPTLTKTGAASLEVEVTTTAAFAINQGFFLNGGSGTVNGVTIAAGATMSNLGIINGGIACSGTATSSGTVNGSLSIASGGVVTNLNTFQHGSFALAGGSLLYNALNATFDDFGSSTVSSNATLINDGILGTFLGGFIQTLTVGGTFIDSGASASPDMSLQTLTFNAGANFIPGGNGIGTSSVRGPIGAGASTDPGRVILNIGSTNVFKVDASNPANLTMLRSGFQDFGPSQNSQQQNGCTIVITNVSSTPFTAGQYFRLFQVSASGGGNIIPTGSATNSFPVISPATPGPGLAWDLSRLWQDNGSGNVGIHYKRHCSADS